MFWGLYNSLGCVMALLRVQSYLREKQRKKVRVGCVRPLGYYRVDPADNYKINRLTMNY